MQNSGTITVNNTKVNYQIKYLENPSKLGINGGRISKLYCKINDTCIMSYERYWEETPKTEVARKVLAKLVNEFN